MHLILLDIYRQSELNKIKRLRNECIQDRKTKYLNPMESVAIQLVFKVENTSILTIYQQPASCLMDNIMVI